MILLFYHLIF